MAEKFTDKWKLRIKNLLEIILVLGICFLLGKLLNYIYVKDCFGVGASWEKAMLHDYYQQEENIDCLFLGSSHVFYDIIPEILNDNSEDNYYSLATPAQPYNATYYLLKEVAKEHNLKRVYLEMYYNIPIVSDYQNKQVLDCNWKILYQMPLSFNKLEYMSQVGKGEYRMMTLFPLRQYSKNAYDYHYIHDVLTNKASEEYKDSKYQYIRTAQDTDEFISKGYYQTTFRMTEGTLTGNYNEIPQPAIRDDSKIYLDKIVNYCREKQIELILFTSPVPDYQLACIGNYDEYITEVNTYAAQANLKYYDFNLCNVKYLDLQSEQYYMDMGHMNLYGAEKFTNFLVDFWEIDNEGIPHDIFYESYQEKLSLLDKKIFGIHIVREDEQADSEQIKKYRVESVDNFTDSEVEFHVLKMVSGSMEETEILDWGKAQTVELPLEETGTLIVEARPVGSTKVTNRVEEKY